MSEWWTYSLGDLQMYSGEVFVRLLARHNAELFPLPLVGLAFGLWLLWAIWRGHAAALRAGLAGLGAWSVLVAWSWFDRHLAEIDTLAPYAAIAFALQGVLMAGAATVQMDDDEVPELRRRLMALALVDTAVTLLPLLDWLLVPAPMRDWHAMPLIGVTPDATALATLGLVIALGRVRWLMVVPFAWCLVSAALRWNLGYLASPVLAVAAIVAVALAFVPLPDRRRGNPALPTGHIEP